MVFFCFVDVFAACLICVYVCVCIYVARAVAILASLPQRSFKPHNCVVVAKNNVDETLLTRSTSLRVAAVDAPPPCRTAVACSGRLTHSSSLESSKRKMFDDADSGVSQPSKLLKVDQGSKGIVFVVVVVLIYRC